MIPTKAETDEVHPMIAQLNVKTEFSGHHTSSLNQNRTQPSSCLKNMELEVKGGQGSKV